MVDSPIRKIIRVDMNAFFASVEQRDNPALWGRPFAVGNGARRGVVAAASCEARKFGVKSALPSVTAPRRCPDLIFVPPRCEVYRDVSRQIYEILARYTDLIQTLSLNEAYLDATVARRALRPPPGKPRKQSARRLWRTGLTSSAGVSCNKFLAKLPSDHRKPNRQFAVTPDMGPAWGETLPVSRFHSVGPVTAGKMKRLGIETVADLPAKSLECLLENFGSSAEWYYAILRGVDERPVNPNRIRKSSGAETTSERDLADAGEIEAGILQMADDVWRRRESRQMFGRTVTVKIKFGDFNQITRRRSHFAVIANHDQLRQSAVDLVPTVLHALKGIRMVGVTVSNFAKTEAKDRIAMTGVPIFVVNQAA